MERSSLKVLLGLDSDGYVVDYQQEFWDGSDWQAPFDTTNAVSLPQAEIDKIVIGASKLIDGAIVVDKAKQAELEAETNKVTPTAEQMMINALGLQNAQLVAKVTALTEKLGGES